MGGPFFHETSRWEQPHSPMKSASREIVVLVLPASFSRNLRQLPAPNSSIAPGRRLMIPLPTDGNAATLVSTPFMLR